MARTTGRLQHRILLAVHELSRDGEGPTARQLEIHLRLNENSSGMRGAIIKLEGQGRLRREGKPLRLYLAGIATRGKAWLDVTGQEEKTLAYIEKRNQAGVEPTAREVMEATGDSKIPHVTSGLAERGLLKRSGYPYRLRVIVPGKAPAPEPPAPVKESAVADLEPDRETGVSIPDIPVGHGLCCATCEHQRLGNLGCRRNRNTRAGRWGSFWCKEHQYREEIAARAKASVNN